MIKEKLKKAHKWITTLNELIQLIYFSGKENQAFDFSIKENKTIQEWYNEYLEDAEFKSLIDSFLNKNEIILCCKKNEDSSYLKISLSNRNYMHKLLNQN
jgi:hypothetical protein